MDALLLRDIEDAEAAAIRAAEHAQRFLPPTTGPASLAPQALSQAVVLIAGARALLEDYTP